MAPRASAYPGDLEIEKIGPEQPVGSQAADGSKPAPEQAAAQEALKKEEAKVQEAKALTKEQAKAEAKEAKIF